MTAADRRVQMLGAAVEIVRAEGVAALTLARLAGACGVTKPIAYQHFGTREGLLSEIYIQLGERHEAAALEAIEARQAGSLDLPGLAHAISAAFIDCVLENGALYGAIGAALAASETGQEDVRADFIRKYAAILGAGVAADPGQVYGLAVAFLGAGESLSNAVLRGDLDRDAATGTLAALFLAAFQGL